MLTTSIDFQEHEMAELVRIIYKGEKYPKEYRDEIDSLLGKSVALATMFTEICIARPDDDKLKILKHIETQFDEIQKSDSLSIMEHVHINGRTAS